jgi:hypothetical protein
MFDTPELSTQRGTPPARYAFDLGLAQGFADI